MSITNKAPSVSLSSTKHTKIIATVGPSTDSYEAIYNLIAAGANGLRLNFSHGTYEERDRQIPWIRKASRALGKPVAIIQDLQGPKIRLGDFEGVITIQAGQSLRFQYKADYEHTGLIPIQYDLSKKVKRGERLYLYDGKVKTIITSVANGIVHARAENDGIIIKRKGMNLPDTDFSGDILTKKDREDIVYGSTQDIDYVALSFVQSDDDIAQLRKILRGLSSNARIIAKVETPAAVANIEAIIQETDAVMIARGDLAVEMPAESVPVTQRNIIGLGIHYKKPTIVATQMMASMMESPEPTRAEVSDVATAVIVGADCVMLSDETANGRYPIEAVSMMKRVILYTEENASIKAVFTEMKTQIKSKQDAISAAIIKLALDLKAQAIVAETKSGATAIQISAQRTSIPVVAVTSDVRVAQQLAIVRSVKSYVRPDHAMAATKLTNWLLLHKVLKKDDVVVTASGKHPGVVGTTDTIKIRIL